MFEFAWPWMLVTLPLPWLVRRFVPPATAVTHGVLRVPSLEDFRAVSEVATLRPAQAPRAWLAALGWLALVIAACNPRWLGEPLGVPNTGRDLMLAIDLSESMETQDFILKDNQVDRLTAIKSVAHDFIKRRAGDRLGLLLFGEQAYLQVPLTFDRSTVEQLLQETAIGLAGRSTAIGDALGLAVKRLRDQDAKQKVVILMTDGANTAGQVTPLRAAELAASAGLKVYTIGIGADEMTVRQLFGSIRVNPSTDLDEKTLRGIADATGGKYFRARDTAALEKIYAELDRLEPSERGEQQFRPIEVLFPWPLSIALLCATLVIYRYMRGNP
jgi:Ca-activated chloride channel family protein